MLVLSRGKNESIRFGNSRLLTVVSVLQQDVGLVVRDFDGVSKPLMLRVEVSADIGLGARVTLVGIRDSRARIGITCPKDLPVFREEVWNAIDDSSSDREAGT